MVFAGRAGCEGKRAAVGPQKQVYLVHRSQPFIILLHRGLITSVIVNSKFDRQFLPVFFDHDAALLVDHIGPGVHEPFEGTDLR